LTSRKKKRYALFTFTGDNNRAYREAHPRDFLQPFNNDGSPNKEFQRAYGETQAVKEMKPDKVRKRMEGVVPKKKSPPNRMSGKLK